MSRKLELSSVAPGLSPFGARLRAILDLPEARERQRQAVALACETVASPGDIRAVLASLPTDAASRFTHADVMFPTGPAARSPEAERCLAIMRSQEAEGRERAALEFVTGTELPADQVVALLSRLPKMAATPAIPTIAERAAGAAEFGASVAASGDRATTRVDAAWERVTGRMNGTTKE